MQKPASHHVDSALLLAAQLTTLMDDLWAACCAGADHISGIFEFPASDVPIPYTELLITAVPGYKRSGKSPNGARIVHCCSCSQCCMHHGTLQDGMLLPEH